MGDRLRRAREKKGLTQVEVSKRIGVNNKTLSGYEKNIGSPTPDTLSKLAELYAVSIDWIVNGLTAVRNIDDEWRDLEKWLLDEGAQWSFRGKELTDDMKRTMIEIAKLVMDPDKRDK